jgi:radical SAM protein with 4Fe4S-binding SPASM domain
MAENTSYAVRKILGRDQLWKGGGPKLARIDIELTERCNNNCIHCYINQPEDHAESRKREMSTAQVCGIVDQAAALGCMTARLTGGEPLLRPDFEEIYLHIRRRGIKVILLTNATLITAELVALLQKYPPGEPVEISLYGMEQKTYEEISRVRGSFAAAMRGVDLLLQKKIPLLFKSIRVPGRDYDIEKFHKFSLEHSADGRMGSISMDFNLRARRDSKERNEMIRKLRAAPQEILANLCRDELAYRRDRRQFAEKFMRPGGKVLFGCGCGKGGSVDGYGMFQPCLLMRHPDLVYDLSQGTIEDALDRFFPEMLQQNSDNPAYLERCAKCFLQGLCNQCPAWSWMENGSLDTPVEYLCEVAHEQARYLGLIKKGEKAWQVKDYKERIDRFVNEDNDKKNA